MERAHGEKLDPQMISHFTKWMNTIMKIETMMALISV